MRSSILGAAIDNPELMREYAKRSSRWTHSDPKAEYGAISVCLAALVARTADSVDATEYFEQLDRQLPVTESANALRALMNDVQDSLKRCESTVDYALRMFGKRGVTGYTYHTVPAAIHAWLSHPDDYRTAVTTMIECGGDADSTAAIVGGIVGARVDESGVPSEFLSLLKEWPCTVDLMRQLAEQFGQPVSDRRIPRTSVVRQSIRNLLFLIVVLGHGFRRLAPPY